jgi:amidase
MIRILREHRTYSFSSKHRPASVADPGDTVIFETEDAGSHRITHSEDIWTYVSRRDYTNPATGPLYVNSARPGDALAVHIERIELDDQGYTKLSSGSGLLIAEVTTPAVQIWQIDGAPGCYRASWGPYTLPCRPMVGTIGTALANRDFDNFTPGPHGGNLDIPLLGEGATVYLPVHVPGGLLGLGDVHALQGDGEISGVALETRGAVTVRVDLLRDEGRKHPWIETTDSWITVGQDLDGRMAMEAAARDMVLLLGRKLMLSPQDALMLMGVTGHMRPGQAIFADDCPVTFYMSLPKPP